MRILNQIKRKNPVETSVQTLARKRRTPILFFILPLPGLIALLMFSYLPMVGLYIVFERYTYQGGLFGSEFVGLKNFEFFFRNMSNALRATRNTLVINCFSILFGIAVNVALAIAVNEIRSVRFRKVTQSIMLFPHFISWVVVGMVFNVLLSEGSGVVNRLLVQLGMDPVKWYTNPWYWWPILVFANVWKSMGYGSLVYFAALTGFDQNLYEAAEIDGAGKIKVFLKIALPMAVPAVVVSLIFSFVWNWNETFNISLYNKDIQTLPMQLNIFVERYREMYPTTDGSEVNRLNESIRMAATLITITPLIVLYIALQKQFVESIERTGITGE